MTTYKVLRQPRHCPERGFADVGEIDAVNAEQAIIRMRQRLQDRANDFEYRTEVVSRATSHFVQRFW